MRKLSHYLQGRKLSGSLTINRYEKIKAIIYKEEAFWVSSINKILREIKTFLQERNFLSLLL